MSILFTAAMVAAGAATARFVIPKAFNLAKNIYETNHINHFVSKLYDLEQADALKVKDGDDVKDLKVENDDLLKTLSSERSDIQSQERQIQKSINIQKNNEKQIETLKEKMKELRKTPLLSRAYLNISHILGNRDAKEYANAKATIKTLKDAVKESKRKISTYSKTLHEALEQHKESKAKYKELENKVSEKHKLVKPNLETLKMYKKSKEKFPEIKNNKDLAEKIDRMKKGEKFTKEDQDKIQTTIKKEIQNDPSNKEKPSQEKNSSEETPFDKSIKLDKDNNFKAKAAQHRY